MRRHEALVVGAGPVGLTSALALHAAGVEVTVLEADAEDRERPGSRAIYVHRASLELLDGARPGLGQQVAAQGLVWPAKRTFWRGREVFARTYAPPPETGLPPFSSLPQTVIERELARACGAAGIEIVRGAEVDAVEVQGDQVELRTTAGARFTAPHVVAADGARSAVRTHTGITLEGSSSENAFVVVDVEEDPDDPSPPARIFHYGHPAVGGRNVLLVPFAGGWRADLQCRTEDDPERFASPDGAAAWVGAVLGERYATRITWVSTYRFLQVVAERFADDTRRVLLAGDAAHLFAPFGARGMNSGIADAVEAAAAIATATPAAIDRYARIRRQAGLSNREAAGSALSAMQSRAPRMWAKRRTAALLALRAERAGQWLDSAPYGPRLGADGRRGY